MIAQERQENEEQEQDRKAEQPPRLAIGAVLPITRAPDLEGKRHKHEAEHPGDDPIEGPGHAERIGRHRRRWKG